MFFLYFVRIFILNVALLYIYFFSFSLLPSVFHFVWTEVKKRRRLYFYHHHHIIIMFPVCAGRNREIPTIWIPISIKEKSLMKMMSLPGLAWSSPCVCICLHAMQFCISFFSVHACPFFAPNSTFFSLSLIHWLSTWSLFCFNNNSSSPIIMNVSMMIMMAVALHATMIFSLSLFSVIISTTIAATVINIFFPSDSSCSSLIQSSRQNRSSSSSPSAKEHNFNIY